METVEINANDLVVTAIHCTDPECHKCQRKMSTRPYLQQMFEEGRTAEIPAVCAVRDTQDNRLLVYDGSSRTSHAQANGYSLRAYIITTEEELDEYCLAYNRLWFDIRSISELLEYMRIYAEYPNLCIDDGIPPHLIHKIQQKYYECKRRKNMLSLSADF